MVLLQKIQVSVLIFAGYKKYDQDLLGGRPLITPRIPGSVLSFARQRRTHAIAFHQALFSKG